MDRHTPQQRSSNMAAIKSTGTVAEKKLATELWKLGYRYRKNDKTIFGKPDLSFKKLKIAIFIDSEFFHGKDFETKKKPINNAEYWEKKISRNIKRDQLVNESLINDGWVVLRFWSKDVLKNILIIIEKFERVYKEKTNNK